MKRFFIGCNLDFESELELELKEVWPWLIELDGRPNCHGLEMVESVPGGLLIQAPLHLGLQLNFFLKTANRILLRVKEFRVRDFPKLFSSLSTLKKDPFLQGMTFHYQVSASESRLNNEKRILQILEEVFGPEGAVDSSQTLYVRMHQDQCSISLDSTGELLHKRSQRVSQGAAPLRESLAAFCLRKLCGEMGANELAGISLVDPMCGAGTFLREAATLFQPSRREDFPFLSWAQTPKILKSPTLKSNYPEFPLLFRELVARDSDPAALERAERALEALEGARFSAKVEDLFLGQPDNVTGPCWVVSNPPYGERLAAEFSSRQLFEQIDKVYKPQRLGLLLSERQARELRQAPHAELKLQNTWSFRNGGLAVEFLVFHRERTS
jgi:putative N6-adenine-specific DNA methylase